MCDFDDFKNILGLVVNHLIGWDEDAGATKEKGGVFGILDAWSAAVEEQGRKMLHIHFLIWIKDWSTLLDGLRSNDKEGVRKLAGSSCKVMLTTLCQQSFMVTCHQKLAKKRTCTFDLSLNMALTF